LFLSFGLVAQSKEEKDGDKALAIEDFEKAKNWYTHALKLDPENAIINTKITKCYVELMQGNNALKHINIALSKTQSNELYYLKANSLQLSHQFDSAAFYYKKSDPLNANKKDISKKLIECESGKKYLENPANYSIRNINQVNTKAHDLAPKITADMSKMYFTSQRVGGDFPENIYLSNLNGGAWTPPINIGAPINSETINDACLGLSPDGQTMYIYKGVNGGDIYESELKGKNWSEPIALSFNTTHRETSVCLSPDGRTIYFVRQMLDENGKKTGSSDIFYCKKTASGDWAKSIKMGANINTDYDEEYPYFHPDGKTLYFSSKGHTSMGGYDIFKCTWDGVSWSKPENLGYPLNTASDERNFVIPANNDYALYAAQRETGSLGGLDIYFITMPPAPKPDLVMLNGKITDEVTGKPVEAKVIITDNDKNEVVAEFHSNAESGEYLVSLPSGINYGISIEMELHVFHSENIYFKASTGYVVEKKDVKLPVLKSGSTIIMRNIFFKSGSYELSPTSNAELQRLKKLLDDNPSIKIQISGHTDNQGDEAANKTLSQRRAEAVLNYLVSLGINKDRLTAYGYGSSSPIADNTTEEGRAKNRRTTFTIR
jgi:outer membrane protein OmpA-like peptidoglycan-associated protein/tetratricopeptide (TPR) repeat protein